MKIVLAITATILAICFATTVTIAGEPIVGLPCENCELVFLGMPDSIQSISRIAPLNEPGEKMRIEGIVRDSSGKPVSGIIIYAYHTDSKGIYPTDSNSVRHGKLRGWAKSDAKGQYHFDTIRPAGYPNSTTPQHVHMHVIEPGRCTYYIDDIMFKDDPRLTAEIEQRFDFARGGNGFVKPTKDQSGTWIAVRDIVLGENINGYPQR